MYVFELDGFSVMLESGYELARTKYGPSVRYQDLDGLRVAIVIALVSKQGRLTVPEARYLRRVSGRTQVEVADSLRVKSGTVSTWERSMGAADISFDVFVRAISADRVGYFDSCSLAGLFDLARETVGPTRMVFAFKGGSWQEAKSNLAVHTVRVGSWVEPAASVRKPAINSGTNRRSVASLMIEMPA